MVNALQTFAFIDTSLVQLIFVFFHKPAGGSYGGRVRNAPKRHHRRRGESQPSWPHCGGGGVSRPRSRHRAHMHVNKY